LREYFSKEGFLFPPFSSQIEGYAFPVKVFGDFPQDIADVFRRFLGHPLKVHGLSLTTQSKFSQMVKDILKKLR